MSSFSLFFLAKQGKREVINGTVEYGNIVGGLERGDEAGVMRHGRWWMVGRQETKGKQIGKIGESGFFIFSGRPIIEGYCTTRKGCKEAKEPVQVFGVKRWWC